MGYNRAKNKMKKVIIIAAMFFTGALIMSSCSKDFLDGYDAGYNGYSYIGTTYSSSACSSSCASMGYTYYRYNQELNNCYCK